MGGGGSVYKQPEANYEYQMFLAQQKLLKLVITADKLSSLTSHFFNAFQMWKYILLSESSTF